MNSETFGFSLISMNHERILHSDGKSMRLSKLNAILFKKSCPEISRMYRNLGG